MASKPANLASGKNDVLSNWRHCAGDVNCQCPANDPSCAQDDFRRYLYAFGVTDPTQAFKHPKLTLTERQNTTATYQFEGHVAIGRHPKAEGANPHRCNFGGDQSYRHECYRLLFTIAANRTPVISGKSSKVMMGAAANIVIEAFEADGKTRLKEPVVRDARFLQNLTPLKTTDGNYVHGWEPSITADGRLLAVSEGFMVNRSAPFALNKWEGPYSTSQLFQLGQTFDPSRGLKLSEIYPIMAKPLLDADGVPCELSKTCGGAYKWISQDGSEMFFTNGTLINHPVNSASPNAVTPKSIVKMAGARTRFTEVHVDGPLNTNRFTWTGFQFSLGVTGTMWEPFPGQRTWQIPFRAAPVSYPMVTSSGVYQEIDFDRFLDGSYLINLPMNELVLSRNSPIDESSPSYFLNALRNAPLYDCSDITLGKFGGTAKCDSRGNAALDDCLKIEKNSDDLKYCYFASSPVRRVSRRYTPDVSGYFNTAVLEGDAKFPSDYFTARNQIPVDENGNINESNGFLGRGIFLDGASSRIRIPGDILESMNRHCKAENNSWKDPLRCNLNNPSAGNHFHAPHRQLSVELAVKLQSAPAERRTLFEKVSSIKGFIQSGANGLELVVALFNPNGNIERIVFSLPPLVNRWLHLGLAFDGNARNLTLYVNGQATSRAISSTQLNGNVSDWFVGGDSNSSYDSAVSMVIDEFAVSSIARSAAYFARQARAPEARSGFVSGDTLEKEGTLPRSITNALSGWGGAYRTHDLSIPAPVAGLMRKGKFDAAVTLGKRLFNDTALTGKGISCASCHQEVVSVQGRPLFIDARKNALTGQTFEKSPGAINNTFTRRHTPMLANRIFSTTQMADGSAFSLVEQAMMPVLNPVEMAGNEASFLKYLKDKYRNDFSSLFEREVSKEDYGAVMASFMVAQIEPPGDADQALIPVRDPKSVQRGAQLFQGKARCISCHSGPNFSDERFHNVGASGTDKQDLGRFEVTRTGSDRFAFKTPSLRGISKTAPYFHTGKAKSLEEVIQHYLTVPRQSTTDPLDPDLLPIFLNPEEVDDLLQFLRAL